jgi:glycosyltransferase involved in cell wall biosynthesis
VIVHILVISSGNVVQLNIYSIYFSKRGHEVTFINPAYSNALTDRTIDDEFTKNNVRFYTWDKFETIWQENKFDVIFGTQQGSSLEMIKYQHRYGIPALQQILDIAEGSNLESTSPQEYRRLCVTQRPFLEAYKKIDHLTGINPVIPKQIEKLVGRKDCRCVFYPTCLPVFDSVPDQETEDFVFMVSRLTPMKKIDFAIKACHSVEKKLVIASNGELRHTMESFAKSLGADVEFLGYIQDKQKAELMKKCKLHIFTQMWDSAAGTPSTEALYCKKPSITFDYPVQRATEGSYSYYTEPGDWQALGDKIKWIYDNYTEAIDFATEGHEWIKNNAAPDVVAQQILSILEKIVKQ